MVRDDARVSAAVARTWMLTAHFMACAPGRAPASAPVWPGTRIALQIAHRIEQVLATEPHDDAWFWATHQGAEIDLILRRGDRLLGIECKRSDAPKMTPSIRHAQNDLGLAEVVVLYPGQKHYPLADGVSAKPLAELKTGRSLFDEP